jgi:hypothetical protein
MTDRLLAAVTRLLRDDRGDVPGWVMITIMTAGIVAVLWQFAGPYLQQVLESALQETVGQP